MKHSRRAAAPTVGYLSAKAPPEARGLERDEVRLMLGSPSRFADTTFRSLPDFLDPGDLLIVNTSRTLAAAVPGVLSGQQMVVHFSTPLRRDRWVVELRMPDASGPILDARVGNTVGVPSGTLTLEEPYGEISGDKIRLWGASLEIEGGVRTLMRRHGAPVRYSYVPDEWPLSYYQTIFSDRRRWPGSAEMPSAGRPFSARVVRALRRKGVRLAGIELHAGVSSQEAHEPPQSERFSVPVQTARAVNAAARRGSKVIAVGTTVTRALETVATESGQVVAAAGWSDLVLGPDRGTRVVKGLITGWHPPEASHLDLLRAVVGSAVVDEAYRRAVVGGYLWHEFGDSCLMLRAGSEP